MPTIFTKGDLLHTEGLAAVAHGANAEGTMDTGVSHAMKTRWPAMFDDFRARCTGGHVHAGDVVEWTDGTSTVFSLVIAETATKKAKLSALVRALEHLTEKAKRRGIERVGLPRLGGGAASLEWKRVKDVLDEAGAKTDVTLVVFEQFVRDKSQS